LKLAGAGTEPKYVFTDPMGAPLHPDYVRRRFDATVKRVGVRRIRFHDLRHTHASLMIAAGVNMKVVSERLGHMDVAFTMRVYQHVMPGMQARAAADFGSAVEAARARRQDSSK
jgi:integrase